MRYRGAFVAAGLLAGMLMALAVSSASARRFEISNQAFRAVWSAMVFSNPEGSVRVVCPATMEGSFHSRTISKVHESLVGYVTRAVIAEAQCQGGRARALPETLPWHVRYASFSGTLPAIRGVLFGVVGMSGLVEPVAGISCLYRSTELQQALVTAEIEAEGRVGPLTWAIEARIGLSSGGLLCPREGSFSGTSAPITLLGTTTRITARLVA
jgi:hypothetical protein